MSKTLKELRTELTNRLGYGAQPGAQQTLKPILDAVLQRSQDQIVREFGLPMCTTGVTYSNGTYLRTDSTAFSTLTEAVDPFIVDSDTASVPETPLLLRALVEAKAHYRQPDSELAAQNWTNWERNVRAGSG